MSRQKQQPRAAGKNKAGEIHCAPPFALLAEARGKNAEDLDAAPVFARGKYFFRVVIRVPSGDDGDLVSAFRQRRRQFAQMLRRGNNVRVKSLVEKKNLHVTTRNGE